MKKKSVIIGVALILISIVSLAYAVTMAPHVDKEGKFTVKYPANWTKELNKEGCNFVATAPDQNALVQIQIQDVDPKISAANALIATEKQFNYTNLLPEDKRVIKANDLKASGGDDGAKGAYNLEANGVAVHQEIMIITKGNRIYVIIQTMGDAQKNVYGPIMNDIVKSFKVL
jgi:hypothetical protein